MSSKWILGVHFDKAEGEEGFICKKCGKKIAKAPGLGPHLTSCWTEKPSEGVPPESSEGVEEFGLDEKQNLINVLKQFGIKYPEGIAGFVEGFGFENLDVIDEALRLSQVNPDKRKLVIQYWANHIGKPIPPTLMQKWSQPTFSPIEMQPPAFQTQQQGLTREDLEAWYQSKRKEEELASLRNEIEQLKRELSEGNPRKSSELEEIKKLLLEKERNEVLDRLRRLEDHVRGISNGVSNVYGLLGLGIREAADLLKNSALRTYILTGQVPEQTPPKEILPQARESIFEKISHKYVVEE